MLKIYIIFMNTTKFIIEFSQNLSVVQSYQKLMSPALLAGVEKEKNRFSSIGKIFKNIGSIISINILRITRFIATGQWVNNDTLTKKINSTIKHLGNHFETIDTNDRNSIKKDKSEREEFIRQGLMTLRQTCTRLKSISLEKKKIELEALENHIGELDQQNNNAIDRDTRLLKQPNIEKIETSYLALKNFIKESFVYDDEAFFDGYPQLQDKLFNLTKTAREALSSPDDKKLLDDEAINKLVSHQSSLLRQLEEQRNVLFTIKSGEDELIKVGSTLLNKLNRIQQAFPDDISLAPLLSTATVSLTELQAKAREARSLQDLEQHKIQIAKIQDIEAQIDLLLKAPLSRLEKRIVELEEEIEMNQEVARKNQTLIQELEQRKLSRGVLERMTSSSDPIELEALKEGEPLLKKKIEQLQRQLEHLRTYHIFQTTSNEYDLVKWSHSIDETLEFYKPNWKMVDSTHFKKFWHKTEKPSPIDTQILMINACIGHPQACALVGLHYELGLGELEKNEIKARQWYEKGIPNQSALWKLGVYYEQGLGGLPKDEVRAREYYEILVHEGSAVGQYHLALFYLKGMGGLSKSPTKALELYTAAANQGYQPAIEKLREFS